MLYATFNRAGHLRDGDVVQMGTPHANEYGDVYFFMASPDGPHESLYPHEFSNWFNINEYGQKVLVNPLTS